MSFSEIKGQDRVVNFLKTSLEKKKIHHAYLFIGNRGVGKTLAAKNLAKAINCLSENQPKPCDECISCAKIDKLQSPDVFFIAPGGDNGTFLINDIKSLQNFIILKPYEAKNKVFIIEDASKMTVDAANSFLKTLEEPPQNSIIILIAHDKSKIISTIYSRCEVVQFAPLSRNILKEIMSEKLGADSSRADYLMHFSEGSLKEQADFKKIDNIIDWKNKIIDKFENSFRPFNDDSSVFGETKNELLRTIEVLSFWYRDIIIAKIGLFDLVVNRDRLDEIKQICAQYSMDDLNDILEKIEYITNSVNSNSNIKLSESVLKMEIEDICMR